MGDNVIVLPTHTEEDGILTVGAFTLIVLDVLLSEVVQPPLAAAMLVTVIVALPGVVKPVAVNCPLPAVVTVIGAVPVPPELLLYVTVYVCAGKPAADEVSVINDEPEEAQTGVAAVVVVMLNTGQV